MPLWVGDYLADTQHLTTEQHGAYLLLLMACWSQGSIPNDDKILAKITGMSPFKWQKNSEIILKFFENNSKIISHKRITAEKARSERNRTQAAEKGRKGGQAAARKRLQIVENGCSPATTHQHQHHQTPTNPPTQDGTLPDEVTQWGGES